MGNKELRGASRRAFLRGATALGAALGWGPAKLLEFIERGGGTAAADCSTKGIQNLVVLVGANGAHGYMHNLFPHPDTFAVSGRFLTGAGDSLAAVDALQTASTGGMVNRSMFVDSAGAPLGADVNTTWNNVPINQRFSKQYGADNQAFGGYKSASTASNANDVAAYGQDTVPKNAAMGSDKKFIVSTPHTPWFKKYGFRKAITAIDGHGINPFHISGAHNSYVDTNKKWTMMAAAATLQLTRPSITPVIISGSFEKSITGGGTTHDFYNPSNVLAGAPEPAIVGTADGMVDLFNSNATLAGGVLADPRNAALYEAYVKGLFGSSKTASVPTFQRGFKAGKQGANLLGVNLANQLRPTDADRQRYGFTASAPTKAAELRDRLIVTAKALRLGLTSQVCLTYFADDPHDSFTNNAVMNSATTGEFMSRVLNAFMDDLMEVPDPFCPGVKLGDNTVVAFIGDTPRTMTLRTNWNDPTCGLQNRVWIMSNGLLKTGFFGGDRTRTGGDAGGETNNHTSPGPGEGGLWDFKTGDLVPFDPASGGTTQGSVMGGNTLYRQTCGEAGMAAVLYAVTRGDIRAVNNFYSGPDFPAIQVPVIL